MTRGCCLKAAGIPTPGPLGLVAQTTTYSYNNSQGYGHAEF